MRIESTGVNPNANLVQTPSQAAQPTSQAAQPTTPSTGAVTGSSDTTSFSPTSDLVKLLTLARQSPDTRPDVIDSVTARLGTGEFSSSAAAGAAASNLLDLSSDG